MFVYLVSRKYDSFHSNKTKIKNRNKTKQDSDSNNIQQKNAELRVTQYILRKV